MSFDCPPRTDIDIPAIGDAVLPRRPPRVDQSNEPAIQRCRSPYSPSASSRSMVSLEVA